MAEQSAVIGALLWLVLFFFEVADPLTSFIARLMLLAVLVIVPLGLSIVAETGEHRASDFLFRAAIYAQPVGALMVIISFLLPQGVMAALLALPWLALTALIALCGLRRLLSKEKLRAPEFAVNAGLAYVVVGGGWLVFSRYGLQPLGFGDTIVLLTAVHFHYAGFAAPLLAGFAGRVLDETSSASIKRIFKLSVIFIISGTPLVAAGITFSSALALLGAVVVTLGLLMLAALVLFRVVPQIRGRIAKALLVVSSLSSISAMALASIYAYSIVTKTLILNIDQMAASHGILNAFGFSLCGFLAWKLVRAAPPERKEKQLRRAA